MLCALALSTAAAGIFAVAQAPEQTAAEQLQTQSFSAYATDYYTGAELYSFNPDEKHEIASMVKIMTATLVFDAINEGKIGLEDEVTVSHNASGMGGSQMFLDADNQYKVNDLLTGVIVASANDASVALAEHICGDTGIFVNAMNERAAGLGMTNTRFVNCTGLPSEQEQYSSARDVNTMTRELMKNPKYYEYASIWTKDFVHPSGRITTLTNTNKMIRQYSGCLGGKTGYTDRAGFCLSACAERGGVKTVATVIGANDSKTRFAEVGKMFNYVFANYTNKTVCKAGERVQSSVHVSKSKVKEITPIAATDVAILIKQGDDVKVEYEYPENLKAPISKGDIVGKIKITHKDKVYYFDLVSESDVERASIWDIIKDLASKW